MAQVQAMAINPFSQVLRNGEEGASNSAMSWIITFFKDYFVSLKVLKKVSSKNVLDKLILYEIYFTNKLKTKIGKKKGEFLHS